MTTPQHPASTLFSYRFGQAEFDESESLLRVDGEPIAVERRPLELLAALLHSPGVVLTKAELLASLWQRNEANLSDNALANAVSKLRRALGEATGALVRTVPGVGYLLEGPIERVAQAHRGDAPLMLKPGQKVAGAEDYRLKSLLAESRNSSVWLAEHKSSRQPSVFKFCNSGDGLSALKREFTLAKVLRRSLGRRPDRVEILAANFSDAPYWLQSEHGGENFLNWATTDPAAKAMNTDQRVALFLQVAQSVAVAHSVGVLHKDIKPANVLIEPRGDSGWQIRLTDFGSGRLLDPGTLQALGVTAMGLTLTERVSLDSGRGTLMYLAPELLSGEVPTVQSDLYALGLMLYQWLVGDFRRPLSTGWEDDIADPLLREDIAAATHGQAVQRCASVAEWAGRLERLVERRQSRAVAESRAVAAAATAQELARNRARRPLVAAVVVSLALGLATSLWFYSRSQRALMLAQQQTERAQAINDFLNKDLLQSADISERGTHANLSLAELLEKASARAGIRFKDQPSAEASIRQQLGQMNMNVSAFSRAAMEFQRAWALCQSQGGAPAALNEGVLARLALSRALTRDSKFNEAKRWLEEAERDAGPLAARGSTEVALQLARTRFTLLSFTHETNAALPFGDQALALQEQLHPDDLADRASLRRDLSDGYYRANQHDRTKELLTVILKPPFSPESIGTVAFERARLALINASMLDADADATQVLSELKLVRDRIVAVLGPDEYTVNAARISMAGVLSVLGRFEEARQESQETHDSLSRTLGADHQATRIAAMNLAVSSVRTGHARQGLGMLEDLRAWAVRTFQHEDHPIVQGIDFYRAQALNELARPALALHVLAPLKADAIAQTAPAADWEFKLQGERGRALALLGRDGEARPLLEAALAGMKANGSAGWFQAPLQDALFLARSTRSPQRQPARAAVTASSS